MEAMDSHLDTDCRDTPSWTASSSWDQPWALRSFMIFSAKIIFPQLLLTGSVLLLSL